MLERDCSYEHRLKHSLCLEVFPVCPVGTDEMRGYPVLEVLQNAGVELKRTSRQVVRESLHVLDESCMITLLLFQSNVIVFRKKPFFSRDMPPVER